jgi:hypothetical protein
MEGVFDADLSDVRLHTGSAASTLNRKLQARAFTVGTEIFFNGPTPDVAATTGQHLLAHELAHTIQQGGTRPGAVRRVIQRRYAKGTAAADAALFDMEHGADTQPDLTAHNAKVAGKSAKLRISSVNMHHFLERHTYKHQQLSEKFRKFDATLWPVGTTVDHVLDGLNQALEKHGDRTGNAPADYTVTMNGKACVVKVGQVTAGVLEQFFPVSGDGTNTYTKGELAAIERVKKSGTPRLPPTGTTK